MAKINACTLKISIHALRGEGDQVGNKKARPGGHFNPRPPWGGRPDIASWVAVKNLISIHALRGEGDLATGDSALLGHQFQSTPSVGRATQGSAIEDPGTDISIHALRGEGDKSRTIEIQSIAISIHALRGEGDITNLFINTIILLFQSTPSVGRATMI